MASLQSNKQPHDSSQGKRDRSPFVGAASRFLILGCPASSTCPHPAPERPPLTRRLSSVGAVEWQPGALWARCIPMLGACRGAPRSKMRISFLYCIGNLAV